MRASSKRLLCNSRMRSAVVCGEGKPSFSVVPRDIFSSPLDEECVARVSNYYPSLDLWL